MVRKTVKQTGERRWLPTTPNVVLAYHRDRRDRFPRPVGVSPEMIDAAAEREFQRRTLGGYSRKDPVCERCFVKKSKTGECNC